MKRIKVRFLRFEGSGTQNPVFADPEGNEYFWPKANEVAMEVAARRFWDELGYNERLRYMITSEERGGKWEVAGVHGIK